MATFYAKYPANIATGSATGVVEGEGTPGVQAGGILTVQGDPSGTPIPVSGSISATNPSVSATGLAVPAQATYIGATVAGNLTGLVATANGLKVDGSAVTQPVSAASLPLPTGAATESTLNTIAAVQGSNTVGQFGPLVQGSVTTAAPTYTTGKIDPLSLTTAGALRVDASASTQPVSGTVAATQSGTWTVQPGNTANTTAWKVDGSAVTQPVSGTVSAAQSGTWNIATVTAVTAISNALPAGTNAIGSVIPTATAAAVWQAEGSTAFGSVTNSYVTILTPSAATKSVFLRNNTNAAVSFSFDAGSTTNVVLDSGDQMAIDYVHNGVIASTSAIQIKYTVGAPTSGSVRVNAYH